ncbi:unnamed protein product, partial [Medioppia subpectinata]
GDAFIMMFIGHGFNESIIGWSAQPQWPPADDTVLPIRDIMTMFSETGKCRALREKIKIFIFNCCRERVAVTAQPKPGAVTVNIGSACAKCLGRLVCTKCEPTMIDTLATLDPTWKEKNKLTHVIYACAEGSKAWYQNFPLTAIGHASVFGQALSHTIAQYSWYKSLYQLILMTVQKSEEDSEKAYQDFLKTNPPKDELDKLGDPVRRPEINMFAVNKELYFNPGQWKEGDDNDLSD